MAKRLFVAPILNTMGPVTDARHQDLLNSWDLVDQANEKYFKEDFRRSLLDSQGREVVISWFPVSFSGFDSNPVNRDFGWFKIYDHLVEKWGNKLKECGDGIYWMYNHPDKSGVGNAWGLDWLHNCHYLNILNRMILERSYFPGVIEIPTAETHSINFVENFFPFELSNRNSPHINWDNIEADGKKTREVLQWADATNSWVPYHPNLSNHQRPGEGKHAIFRLLDIKSRIMSFPEDEIRSAFKSCMDGHDVVIAGYEHDFRDRCDVVRDLFLLPIKKIAQEYPDVEIINTNFQSAVLECSKKPNLAAPKFTISIKKEYLSIESDCELYGQTPYVAIKRLESDDFFHVNPTINGYRNWAIQMSALPASFQIGIAGFSKGGRQSVARFQVVGGTISVLPNNSITIPL